ncbi:MAG: HEPN domain-containing protein [Candidatus Thermoplasmatota archaeon]|nr:HEPN domain-containing protein [Candidatus Thermoplasmatota archaeon]
MGVEIAEKAIDTAESWISTAETMAEKKIYNTCLYSEEMAVEIALKAVLIAINIEPPKIHNIIEIVEKIIVNSQKISKDKREEIREIARSLLPELLGNKQTSGYTFNYNIDSETLEAIALKYLEPSKKAVSLCKNMVKQMSV